MNKYCFLFFCFGIWACNESSKTSEERDSITVASNQHDTITETPGVTEKQSGAMSGMDCDAALNRMFQTSNYKPLDNLHLPDYRIHISDEPGDGTSLGLNLYHITKRDSAVLGILNLDLQTGKLVDLSPNLDSEVVITYDSSWLKIIRKQCGQ